MLTLEMRNEATGEVMAQRQVPIYESYYEVFGRPFWLAKREPSLGERLQDAGSGTTAALAPRPFKISASHYVVAGHLGVTFVISYLVFLLFVPTRRQEEEEFTGGE